MKRFTDLHLGFGDAENYKKREHKELLNKFFTRTDELFDILKPEKYFLIGDKGTGKTAYSLYLANNEIKNTNSQLRYIRETEYIKFLKLKAEKHLTLSEYTSIWRVLIYILLAEQIKNSERHNVLFSKFSKFRPLQQAIDEFYKSAFSPEIINALNIIDESEFAAELLNKYFKLSGSEKHTESFTESRFQINLLYIQKKFEEAFQSMNLEKNHILFIDGIDIRPRKIQFEDYLECVKGLANAVWAINNDYFSTIKGSKGKLKVCILVRPDIFSRLGLQNLNNKIRDNSVLLDWKTTYPHYRESKIFKIADSIIAANHVEIKKHGEYWDYYIPFQPFVYRKKEDSFISFLRYSMFRPRDIITMLVILQEKIKGELDRKLPVIDENDFKDPLFRARYSDYLLGEIKDYLAFYHSDIDYELFLKFFEYINGKTDFNYEFFMDCYDKFADYIEKNEIEVPVFFESSGAFLQFLYDMNVICFIERTEHFEPHIHWSYRDRSYSNLNPKVKEGVEYSIHYGLQKAFNTGQSFRKRTIHRKRKVKKQPPTR